MILAHYIFDDPRLDDPAAVAAFVADKDRENADLAGERVTHTERVVDGHTGYVWEHRLRNGGWYSTTWFPQPVHTVRLECVGRRQTDRFKRLCAEAVRSLRFGASGRRSDRRRRSASRPGRSRRPRRACRRPCPAGS